jgi:hypothetical protein
MEIPVTQGGRLPATVFTVDEAPDAVAVAHLIAKDGTKLVHAHT